MASVAASISSCFHGDNLSASSSSLFTRNTLNFSPPISGYDYNRRKQFIVLAKRLSGLEEAMRIGREREQNRSVSVKHRTPLSRLKVSPRLPVPDHIQKPPYVSSKLLPEIASEFQIHDEEGIARMRAACELAARVLEHAGTLVRVRTSTNLQSIPLFGI